MNELKLTKKEKEKVYGTIVFDDLLSPWWIIFGFIVLLGLFVPGKTAPSIIYQIGVGAGLILFFLFCLYPLTRVIILSSKRKELKNNIFDNDIAKFYEVRAKVIVKIKNNAPSTYFIEYYDDFNYIKPQKIQTKFVNKNTLNIFWDMLEIIGNQNGVVEVEGNFLIVEVGKYNRAFLMHLVFEDYNYTTKL